MAEEWADPRAEVIGAVTIVYEHHAHELAHVLTDLQHHYHECIICSTHIHHGRAQLPGSDHRARSQRSRHGDRECADQHARGETRQISQHDHWD